MEHDFIDHLLSQWHEARPDLDASPMSLVARLARIGVLLERRLAAGLEAHGLTVWEFDVLATLRHNEAGGLPPKRLIGEILLSSGAMTNRIDRLEESGYVERHPEPSDRRGVIVRLTRKGRAVVDPAVEDRFEDARRVAAMLGRREREEMIGTMRKLLIALEKEETR
jgi:DNA-binding MarR family transcriptional regulator